MGYIYAVFPEGDNIPDGESSGVAFFNINGFALPYQWIHALSRYPQRDHFSVAELFQDQMIDYLLISKIFHSGL